MAIKQNCPIFDFPLYLNQQKRSQILRLQKLSFKSFQPQILNPIFDMVGCLLKKPICSVVQVKCTRKVGYAYEVGKRRDNRLLVPFLNKRSANLFTITHTNILRIMRLSCLFIQGNRLEPLAVSMPHGSLVALPEIWPWSRVEVVRLAQIDAVAGVEIYFGLLQSFSKLLYIVVALVTRSIAMSIVFEFYFDRPLIKFDVQRGSYMFSDQFLPHAGSTLVVSRILPRANLNFLKLPPKID